MNEKRIVGSKYVLDYRNDMILHSQLRQLLKENDVAVSQLGRATKISPKTLYQWLNGQKPRDMTQVKKVADFFRVSIDFLVFGSEGKTERSFEDFKDEITAGVYEIILRKPKGREE